MLAIDVGGDVTYGTAIGTVPRPPNVEENIEPAPPTKVEISRLADAANLKAQSKALSAYICTNLGTLFSSYPHSCIYPRFQFQL